MNRAATRRSTHTRRMRRTHQAATRAATPAIVQVTPRTTVPVLAAAPLNGARQGFGQGPRAAAPAWSTARAR